MKVGERVLVETKDKKYEGVVLPSVKKGSVVLKLDSGYNIGVSEKNVKNVKVLKKVKKKKTSDSKKHVHKKSKKTVAILHTGGTIASKVDYETGAVLSQFSPEDLISMFPELEDLANLNSRLMANMWSDDMRFAHYNVMAKEIQKEIKKGVDGIILTQGTDTIHYTSAALSFALGDLPVPVIIVGAQRSSDRGSSDAAVNLLSAVHFIVGSDFAGVGVCMHKGLSDDVCWVLPGLKCRKMHSSRRNAFQPINALAIAEVHYRKGKVKFVSKKYVKKNDQKLKLELFNENLKIGLIKARPQMFAEEYKVFLKYDGLVLEGTGLGHMPINNIDKFTGEHEKMLGELKKLAKKMPVVMATQTLFGRVDMNVYSPGRILQDIGVLGNLSDMTPETSYIKLAWLLSNYPKQVNELFMENLRGEFNKRIGKEFL